MLRQYVQPQELVRTCMNEQLTNVQDVKNSKQSIADEIDLGVGGLLHKECAVPQLALHHTPPFVTWFETLVLCISKASDPLARTNLIRQVA